MEKQGSPTQELQCVGRLEIGRVRPTGFLCGSMPVSTDEVFRDFTSSALVPSSVTLRAPRYQKIPTETDLNALPLLSTLPEKVLPVARRWIRTADDSAWQGGPVVSSLARKGEELAVCGIVDYGDEIDVIAPADVLKQIFKIPYSKSRVSVAVHRIGQTLILGSGPDAEEGEKLIQRHKHQPKCADQSLFLNFAMHSVRMEACDCPPSHNISAEKVYKSSSYSGKYQTNTRNHMQGHSSHGEHDSFPQVECNMTHHEFIQGKDNLHVEKKKNNGHEGKQTAEVKEKTKFFGEESDNYAKFSEDGFLRVFIWKFHNFRILLGSDLLVFSNDKYAAVSLHLWDISRKVTPLTWLEAWLDNFMASVPELAICYHRDGVVQGYELIKTDDIFLLKGICDDGTPAFHPHVVQQNGLSVMRFLQENCKQEPGAYWLYRNSGEDVIQLFDLSVIPKNHNSDGCHDDCGSLPSLISRGRSDSMLSLGTLLYRVAHRLSLSLSANNKARCISYFQKCFGLLEDPDHLVVRALAHEQFARLLLSYDEELELLPAAIRSESEVTISDAFEFMTTLSTPATQDVACPRSIPVWHGGDVEQRQDLESKNCDDVLLQRNIAPSVVPEVFSSSEKNDIDTSPLDCNFVTSMFDNGVETFADPLASKLAAVQHVSQAIKSLRWTRQLQSTKKVLKLENGTEDGQDFSLCACGVLDCIEVCDIREWLPTSKIDDKLWKLLLLLGESYLALAQAYKDCGQLHQALKVIELACLVYGSMPQDSRFISSMVLNSASSNLVGVVALNDLSSNFIFWTKAWTLAGDVFVELYLKNSEELSRETKRKNCANDLKVSSDVLKELRRLKKKLAQINPNCSSCSLLNCSCKSDRATSGNCASSSGRNPHSSSFVRKLNRKGRNNCSHAENFNYEFPEMHQKDACDHKSGTTEDPSIITNSRSVKQLTAACTGYYGYQKNNNLSSTGDASFEITSGSKRSTGCGGIFKYLRGDSVDGDADHILSVALSCYDEAVKAMDSLPTNSSELQSVLKKIGWVCNELGRNRLEMKDMVKAEMVFLKAIDAFRLVGDVTNVILIYCNLGHGRRALAEGIVANIDELKSQAIFRNAYTQAVEAAKLQYNEAIRYYGTAKAELNSLVEKAGPFSSTLNSEVYTQFAHTYLKLGMLLSRENTVGEEVYKNCVLDDGCFDAPTQAQDMHRKHEISANEAIREALAMYESLGDLRRQEAAYAYYQLACHQRDCCVRFLESDKKKESSAKGESSTSHKVKQYVSLAERNWQKSMDFYGPKSHPEMYLTILMDRSAFCLVLASSYLHSNSVLESALTRLLEGRHVYESRSLSTSNEICARFLSQLRTVLKTMLASTRPSKHATRLPQTLPGRSFDARKLAELYKMSLKSSDFSQLPKIHCMWAES